MNKPHPSLPPFGRKYAYFFLLVAVHILHLGALELFVTTPSKDKFSV